MAEEPIDGESLHKGLGVRRPDLGDSLSPTLAKNMRIDTDNAPEIILATVIHQLKVAIEAATRDPKNRTMLTAAYNLDRDPRLTALILTERLKVLNDRHGDGYSLSTSQKVVAKLIKKKMQAILSRVFSFPPDAEIQRLVKLETDYALRSTGIGKRTADHPVLLLSPDAIADLISDTTGLNRRFLETTVLPQAEWHVEVSRDGFLVTAVTPSGEYVRAFTSEDLLQEYQEAAGAPSTHQAHVTVGRKILNILFDDGKVGLVLNPPPRPGLQAGAGTHWTAAELARLTDNPTARPALER
ncbi:MAG: hypothetical protein M3443_07985 [Actinomycetota bacterium]|nr:hypothetical protein [Actinomycetota bacterium]